MENLNTQRYSSQYGGSKAKHTFKNQKIIFALITNHVRGYKILNNFLNINIIGKHFKNIKHLRITVKSYIRF